MRIASIAVRLPSLKISNEDLISITAFEDEAASSDLIETCQREVRSLLSKAGARTRFFRDRSKGETALGLLKAAAADALEQARLARADVDLLIYCGVGRGFLEPGNSYFVAHALDLSCPCFDVLDACMSWTRSLEIAYKYLQDGSVRNVMIVNAEFTVYECGYPTIFRMRSLDQLQYVFPAFTIGEAATATILSRSDDRWQFKIESMPAFAGLCSIPLDGYSDFCDKPAQVGLNGPNRFMSFGSKLFQKAVPEVMQLIRKNVLDVSKVDVWFPHVAASVPYRRIAERLGISADRLYVNSFPEYGNLISASIPAAMHRAASDGALNRGDSVVLCPASAGMAVGVVQFVY